MIVLYNPRSLVRGKQRLPHMLLALGAALGDGYRIIDGNVEEQPLDSIRQALGADGERPIIGMTVMPGQQLQTAIRHTMKLRVSCPDAFIIWGGYFATEHREVVLRSGLIDAVVKGQGEMTLLELRDSLRREGRRGLKAVSGLAYIAEDGEFLDNPPRPLADINDFPAYPYESIDPRRYLVPTHLGSRTLSHNASVGCYERCNFCSITTLFNARWIPEKSERVLDQVTRFARNYRANGLEFFDAHFFASEKRAVEIGEGLAPLGFSWWAQSRVDSFLRYSDASLSCLRRSGLGMVFFGCRVGL